MHRFVKSSFSAPLALLLAAAQLAAEDLPERADGSWITLSGTVETAIADSFLLDYGHGTIKVEMDDRDAIAEGHKLLPGDKVRVLGVVDEHLFADKTIEASRVHVEGLATDVHASARDEDWAGEERFPVLTTPITSGSAVLEGRVTEVGEDELVLDTGPRRITVGLEGLADDPLDEAGYPRVRAGDRVRVRGTVDERLMEERRLSADSVQALPPIGRGSKDERPNAAR